MRRKEFVWGGLIVLAGYLLAILIGGILIPIGWYTMFAIVAMNVALFVFYLMFLLKKLPKDFYDQDALDLKVRISIVLGIVYFLTSPLWFFLPEEYHKPVCRIGMNLLLFYWMAVGGYVAFSKVFFDMPLEKFKRYKWFHIRCGLMLMANWYLFLFLFPYSCSSSSDGKHIVEHVQDGRDTYETRYNKERCQYQKEVHLRDNVVPIGYIIYYKDYPDEIDYIDTLYVGTEKK